MAHIVEKTNPLTGAVEQVDQLDHTAQQIDDGIDRAFLVPGQNLLDNSVFLPGCLVDQRQGYVVPPGATVYEETSLSTIVGTLGAYYTVIEKASTYAKIKADTGAALQYWYAPVSAAVRGYTGAGYGPDRWICTNGTLKILENSIELNGIINQKFEKDLPHGAYTISAIAGDVLYSNTFQYNGDSIGWSVLGGGVTYQIVVGDRFSVDFGTTSPIQISAAALNPGDHQTAFHKDSSGNWQLNELPNYADTLARCKQYKQDIGVGIIGVWQNETTLFLSGQFPVQMRAIPTVTLKSKSVTGHTLGTGDFTTDNATIGIQRLMENGIDYLQIVGFSGGLPGRVVVLDDNYLDLNAEL